MDDAAAVAFEKRRREEPPAAGAEAMDDVAAASSSQKRRRDEPESEEPPARRDGGSGEDAGLDLISELPVELHGVILSRLPSTKGAARTAILSSQWRDTWRSTPLDLAGQERNRQGRLWGRITAVSEILAVHRGPVRHLTLETIRLGRDRYAKFDGWFRSPVLDGLEELQF
uniref:F-box domain-containing protein n=1 Tax=Triticum urartu TaxID=4572 RepID=A0A8R7UIN2_TRIUA